MSDEERQHDRAVGMEKNIIIIIIIIMIIRVRGHVGVVFKNIPMTIRNYDWLPQYDYPYPHIHIPSPQQHLAALSSLSTMRARHLRCQVMRRQMPHHLQRWF